MNLYQMNARYNAEADRILFRLNTREGQVFVFDLTRRFVRALWPVLTDLLKTDFQQREPGKDHVADAMLEFEQEENLEKADFHTPFEADDPVFPLGNVPLLLSRIAVKKRPGGGRILSLLPGKGPGIELPVHPRFIHTFRKLIRDLAYRARWDLNLGENEHSDTQRPIRRMLH
ncbi:MAG: hypothetical protein ACLFQY_19630 [Desulfococcaceae bacterium]